MMVMLEGAAPKRIENSLPEIGRQSRIAFAMTFVHLKTNPMLVLIPVTGEVNLVSATSWHLTNFFQSPSMFRMAPVMRNLHKH